MLTSWNSSGGGPPRLGAGECDIWGGAEEAGFAQPGEGKAWWVVKLLSSPALWLDFRVPSMQFSGKQSCLHSQILFDASCLTTQWSLRNWDTTVTLQVWAKTEGKEQPLHEQTQRVGYYQLPLGSHSITPQDRFWQSVIAYREDGCLISVPLCWGREAVTVSLPYPAISGQLS